MNKLHIYQWKHSSLNQRLLGILQGIVAIADGLVIVITLSTFATNWEMLVASKRAKAFILQQHKKAESK